MTYFGAGRATLTAMSLPGFARTIAVGGIAVGVACTQSPSQPNCAGVGGAPMVEYQLFFGRDIAGRPALTDQEWADFAEQVVTPQLPDGFTAFDADGQWMNPATRRIIREQTKVIIVALPATDTTTFAIATVRNAYRTRFHQQSVGMTAQPVCGAF
jgi:uncharacterized protein DUF3574